MRLTTNHRRPPDRHALPAPKARNPVVQAVLNGLGTVSGSTQREADRARERFERLDFDQRVREVGEW
jgi:hypothetical protein